MAACGYLKWFSRDLAIPPSLFTIEQTFCLFSVQFLKNEDFLTRNEKFGCLKEMLLLENVGFDASASTID